MSSSEGTTLGVGNFRIEVLTANSLLILSVASSLNLSKQKNKKDLHLSFVTSLQCIFKIYKFELRAWIWIKEHTGTLGLHD
jgi:hypothetical protein